MADVTAIIPCYNAESFIAATIRSVLNQTDAPREILVIDDGSTDATATVVQNLMDQFPDKIHLIRQSNCGESQARNTAIDLSSCRFIAFLDSDDLWEPAKTQKQIQTMDRHPDVVAVYSRVFNFETELGDRNHEETEHTRDNPTVEALIGYHYVTPSSLMVRRAVLDQEQICFNPAVRHGEDMLFAADLRLAGPIRLVDQPLVAKRIHPTQQSRSSWHPLWSLKSRVEWCQCHHQKLGPNRLDSLMETLGQLMVDLLEDQYWRRQLTGFTQARRLVRQLFPDLLKKSVVANRFIYPKWVYRARDLI